MIPAAYTSGREARMTGRTKNTNPYPYMTTLWAWWLAGWNDKDMKQ